MLLDMTCLLPVWRASSKDAESIVGCVATIFVPTKVHPANAMTNENPVNIMLKLGNG
jgi:hypothetical protein